MNQEDKREIMWNLVNSGLAGALVLLGSVADGDWSMKGLCVALVAALIVAITKFKDYWTAEEKDYKHMKLFSFIK